MVYASFLLIALLYASVGQAGASGYIAVMALLEFAPESIRPTALVLNTLVSVLVTWRFIRSVRVDWKLLWPFALAAVPMALVGGALTLPVLWFDRLLGSLLLVAGIPFFLKKPNEENIKPPRVAVALLVGSIIGVLSGLTGVGGGILITPLLIYCRWARVKTAAAISAPFILLNSLAALAGHWGSTSQLPENVWGLAMIALLGALIGSHLGIKFLPTNAVQKILGGILLMSGLKLLIG
ncbi:MULTISPECIES: sulfite exporter TauE/SafE family protein [Pseudomonas]|uniref:sulfite exporter TauE/SafE family protein n=1 Tax=Pseudomonas TaxID=286 RepID=UPI0002A332AC|nr:MULTISPECIES: sulfite exporter TauE/SafE family protein [Pseudomonas]MBF3001666.1 sulfite exporter TauE/SafE family protein [Pseudomonas aeruginosa]MBF3193017.1 sulfite exporter TauE/SafE family protein [Pseudomonas aeruginosa]MBF3210381.1 sulfite exporter TauE/SafE family protein [Pseudomonas aeruginosa]NTX89392.1 sulfite exporter TauE/SafE family protein [Pseudomonas sp. UMA643]NTY19301.1 sulfite exporter TauE/SafE family protein [Pseudomonas sp. UMC3103]